MMRGMLDSIPKVITDLSGNFHLNGVALFSCYRNTHLARDLARVLHWLLVTLPVLLSMAQLQPWPRVQPLLHAFRIQDDHHSQHECDQQPESRDQQQQSCGEPVWWLCGTGW